MAVYRTFSTKSQCNLEFRMKRKMYNFLSLQVIYVFPTAVLQDNFLIFWFQFVEQ